MPIVRLIIDLLRLRVGPQDMPGSQTALLTAVGAYYIAQALQSLILMPLPQALFQALVTALVMAMYASAILRIRGVSNRLPQTLVALYASGAALTALLMLATPAIGDFLHALEQSGSLDNAPQPPTLAVLAFMFIGIWGIAVSAHIYRHALDGRFWLGLAAVLGYDLVVFLVFSIVGGVGG